ncbi:ataxin-2-like [Haemorhous mexicanus]|uniref:ataxin-2-like n=1 Tax=Haemorhous mexicanus TaxID=30427 RepID=UPI0028BEE15E|nr:ataxin-2-like [Haemorhous mexicanus]
MMSEVFANLFDSGASHSSGPARAARRAPALPQAAVRHVRHRQRPRSRCCRALARRDGATSAGKGCPARARPRPTWERHPAGHRVSPGEADGGRNPPPCRQRPASWRGAAEEEEPLQPGSHRGGDGRSPATPPAPREPSPTAPSPRGRGGDATLDPAR